MILSATDELFDYIPSSTPARRNSDDRPADRSVFAAQSPEVRYTFRTAIDFRPEDQSLICNCREAPPNWSDIKHALAHFREEEKRVVRRVIIYCHPQVFRDLYGVFQFRKFAREITLESNHGRFAGLFALTKDLKIPNDKPASEKQAETEINKNL
jgi:hypothetical protein